MGPPLVFEHGSELTGMSTLGRIAGAVSERRWSIFTAVRDEMARVMNMLQDYTLSPQADFFFLRDVDCGLRTVIH